MSDTTRILVIDDDAIVCQSCQGILVTDGHEVRMAQTGEDAMRMLQSEHFDVALLDLRIPGTGGLKLLRAIRKASPQTEVVVITGYPSIENAQESIRLGAFDYVAKPFVPQTLRSVIWQALSCKPWMIQERC
jgi:two-component system, OmpR family, phosphate regulon sensor histidine kinase PhoR